MVQSLHNWSEHRPRDEQGSVGDSANNRQPTKLVIPDIFCNSPGSASNHRPINGIASSSSTSLNKPEFGDRRHSESINTNSNNNNNGRINTRPRSEAARGSEAEVGKRSGQPNGNPFQDDLAPVWATRSAISSPECNSGYQYEYKQVGDTPSTPDLVQLRSNGHLHTGDFNSARSNSSRLSSAPQSPVLIQRGLSDGERADLLQQQAHHGNKPRLPAGEQVEECVLDDGALHEGRLGQSGGDGDNMDQEDFEDENWSKLGGEVITVELEQNNYGLGLSLAGAKDRDIMRTYICGLHPRGIASTSGKLQAGDQLLKVGEEVVWDRCHLNVTTIIKNQSAMEKLRLVVLRNKQSLEQLSVKPISQYPLLLDDMIFEGEEFKKFRAKRELRVHKGKLGLGIMIIEGSHKATGTGIFVSDIQERSAAFHSGLKVGDMILAINTATFLQISYDEAVSIIKSLGGNVKMLVTNPKEEEEKKAEAEAPAALQPRRESCSQAAVGPSPAKAASANQPKPEQKEEEKKVEEKKGEESKVELKRDSGGLGLSIVGGSDTPLGGVFIHEIHAGGAAEKTGALHHGDLVTKVNETDFKSITHKDALAALRASDKVVVHFTVKAEEAHTKITVVLVKKSGRGLGLSVVGRRDGPGVFISALVPGGLAEQNATLLQGDQIIRVNSTDLTNATQDAAVTVLKTVTGEVTLEA